MSDTFKIALIGCGKMGLEIEKQAQSLGLEISQKIDHQHDLASTTFRPGEVAIEFTTPESCISNIEHLLQKNIPIICGTTGWYEQIDDVRHLVEKHGGSFLYASNFSIGVHLFWQTLDFLSKKINDFPQYDVRAQETHHIYKKDQPSGTAKTCQHIIEQNIDRITHLPTESFRQGEVFGDHHLFFESAVDCIEINHKAKSRAGFALGAIACAQWIADKKGFFNIDHYLQEKY